MIAADESFQNPLDLPPVRTGEYIESTWRILQAPWLVERFSATHSRPVNPIL
jgi:hypothetical protein